MTLFIQQAGFLNFITHVGSNYHTGIQTEIAAACTSHMHREAEHSQLTFTSVFFHSRGWSGGAMLLGKLPVPGRPTSLEKSRARAYCACSWCGRGWFGHFFSHLSFLCSFSLSLGDGPI